MAKRPRGESEEPGEDADAEGAGPPAHLGDPGSMLGAETMVAGKAHIGRPGAAERNRIADSITSRSGTPGAVPDGPKTIIEPKLDESGRRSIEMENSAAVILADQGWRIKQNPTPDEVALARQEAGDRGSPSKNPDYLIEGKVFDCYSPINPAKSPRGIWSEVRDDKINKLQTQRVVINLGN